ncbi:MAG: MBL fold metallo-hydrolase [Spirochaetae bacterium HGW-Spirochaetae-3]|jgi:competence protein ComEC|nr:MAG: MBL fold metallo-hydrolase [Spirochaetae bacterium HGW-Spirochaetae-3]
MTRGGRASGAWAALALAVLIGSGSVLPAAAQEVAPGRLDEVLDRSGDAGNLVARFWRLSLPSDTDDKSGDSALLVSPDGKTMLIDGGAPECGAQVAAYLGAMGVTRLDAVVASHPHIDHIGGLVRLLASYDVGTVYMSRVEYPTATYRDYIAAIAKRGVEVVYLEAGSEFRFGDLVRVAVYNPEPDIEYYDGYPKNSTQFVNDRSLVMRFAYGDSSMLFMGDVYTSRELDLLEGYGDSLKADVIKVGHHGSDTSSSKSFVRAVAPAVAVMMHDNLASLSVYKNYRKVGARVFATFLDGCVKVSVDGAGGLSVVTESERLSDFLE